MLGAVQRYLAAHGRASLGQLALHFDVAPPAVEGMLQRLIAKGKVRRLPAPRRCRGCGICDVALLEVFEWVGDAG
jgi:DNA-binding MarR family transcriptional regulator